MRIALIARIDKGNKSHIGVLNKLQGISNGFNSLDHEVDLFHMADKKLMHNGAVVSDKIITRSNFLDQVWTCIKKNEYDIIWIRHSIYGFGLLKLLKNLRSLNTSTKLLYELPTYPYKYEFVGWERTLIELHTKTIMSQLHKYIDVILCCNRFQTLFNLPVVHFSNGIENSLYSSQATFQPSTQKINLIAVGTLWKWFGLDRLIKGIASYTGTVRLQLHILGTGPESDYLRKLASDLSIDKDCVTFYQWMKVVDLPKESFENSIGVGVLAAHRKNLMETFALKHREYAACGMPLILAGTDGDLHSQTWVYPVETNEDPIDIENLVQWFESQEINNFEIKDFSIQYLDWSIKVKSVLKSIQSIVDAN